MVLRLISRDLILTEPEQDRVRPGFEIIGGVVISEGYVQRIHIFSLSAYSKNEFENKITCILTKQQQQQ